VFAAVALALGSTVVVAQVRTTYEMPAKPLSQALRDYGRVADVQIIFTEDLVRGRMAPGLKGDFTPADALQKLLEGTGLRAQKTPSGAVMILRSGDASPTDSGGAGSSATGAAPGNAMTLDVVVVTGTRMWGATAATLSSPIRVVGREEIDRSGYATTGDVIRSLPQAFSGNQNVGSFPISGMAPENNFSAASSADLRGLGPGATLTLLNGHRLAYNGYANTIDIGMIPLPALDRVEVVTDGASALYGSDAVAGVVNFILRDDFEGAETTARLGGSSDGGAAERQFSQLLGKSWSGGNVLLNLERFEKEALYADQREVSADLLDPSTLLPKMSRNSMLLAFNQELSPGVSMFVEGLYSTKDVKAESAYSYRPPDIFYIKQSTDTKQWGLNAGVRLDLPGEWHGEIAATMSANNEDYLELHSVYEPYVVFFDNRLRSMEANAEGPLFTLPAGEVTTAVGLGFREEELQGQFVDVAQGGERSVKYAYGEMIVPALAVNDDKLNVSMSGRYESYDDFGSVSNPKLGLVYLHGSSLKLRATWGKSFRAPSLYQAHGMRQATIYPAATFRVPGAAADAQAIYLTGANPELGPERSKSWTAGMDLTPESVRGLRLSLTYYEIDYRDRIVGGGNTIGIWDNPQFQHMIVKYPGAAYLADLLSPPTSVSSALDVPLDPAKVVAVFKVNQRNAPTQDIRGVDLGGNYEWNAGSSYFNVFADASWLDIGQVDTSGSAERQLTGYVYFPAERKMRAGLNWNRGKLSASGIVNHISGSTDNTGTFISGAVNDGVPVGSWTTVDAQFSYDTRDTGKDASGLRVSLAARNLLNRAPPAVAGSSGGPLSRGLGFDPQNASALGRFLSVTVSKRW